MVWPFCFSSLKISGLISGNLVQTQMQFHLKERGWGGAASLNPIRFNKIIFHRAVWSFHLLQHRTHYSKLSLKFNTQRGPWNLNKSTGKQLTSFWLERWWEGAEGWREAWKIWPCAKKVGSHKSYSQHLVGDCDYIPWGSGNFTACLPAPAACPCRLRWLWAPIMLPESSFSY